MASSISNPEPFKILHTYYNTSKCHHQGLENKKRTATYHFGFRISRCDTSEAGKPGGWQARGEWRIHHQAWPNYVTVCSCVDWVKRTVQERGSRDRLSRTRNKFSSLYFEKRNAPGSSQVVTWQHFPNACLREQSVIITVVLNHLHTSGDAIRHAKPPTTNHHHHHIQSNSGY